MMTLAENNEPGTMEVQPNTRSRKKSIVWEHFTVKNVGAGCTRACCNQCKQTFAYSTGTKLSGTSHLKRHIASGTCLASCRKEKNQLKSSASRSDGTGSVMDPPKKQFNRSCSVNLRFDQELCRYELAKMIIMHDYPLHMVEHRAFVSFIKTLQPQFNMVDFDTVQRDCLTIYHRKKQDLLELLGGIPGRISLSVDLCTSSETLGYIFLTGHFINSGWRLHSWILNVVKVPFPYTIDALSHAVGVCLGEWGLENKLFSLTLNKSIFRSDLGSLRGYISVKNPLILNGKLLIEHCFTQVLSSLVRDAVEGMQETINKVRRSIEYVKTSQTHENKFLELKQQLQVPSMKCLSLDDQRQWNTTYFMLDAAVELKEVFSCLDTTDQNHQIILSMDDWKQIETLCVYLKLLYDATNFVSSATHPTTDVFFHEALKLQLELLCSAASQDPMVFNIVKPLQEKFDIYWKDCSLILAIAVVLDPQFKMKMVEGCFSKIYGNETSMYIKMVDEGIQELFSEYVMQFLPLSSYIEQESLDEIKMEIKMEEPFEISAGTLPTEDSEIKLEIKMEEPFDISAETLPADDFFNSVFMSELSGSMYTKSELDQYLEEPVVPYTVDFDILSWWDLNHFKYPALSKMARDILSLPVSTVAPKSVFTTGSRELNHNWSSLQPETVQALVCAKDWLR